MLALLALAVLSCAAPSQGSAVLELLTPDELSVRYGELDVGRCEGDERSLELTWHLWVPADEPDVRYLPAPTPSLAPERVHACAPAAAAESLPKPAGAPPPPARGTPPLPLDPSDPLLPLVEPLGLPAIALYLLGRDLLWPQVKKRRARRDGR